MVCRDIRQMRYPWEFALNDVGKEVFHCRFNSISVNGKHFIEVFQQLGFIYQVQCKGVGTQSRQ